MKYVIVSRNEAQGNSTSDIANPLQVTEIATELIITRLYLLDQLSLGNVSVDDTVVCIDERKCLYTKIFKNVISWDEYRDTVKETEHEVVDYLEEGIFNQLAGGAVYTRLLPYLPFYQNYERDKALINNVELVEIDQKKVSKPFIGLVIRKRKAWQEKNMSDAFWATVIGRLKETGHTVFVFGKETESFCDGKNVHYVPNYQEWCSVVSHPNCMHVGSTMTGAVYPLLIFGNPKCKMTIIDNTRLMETFSYDPSFYNECINFQKISIDFIKQIPTTEEYYDRLISNL